MAKKHGFYFSSAAPKRLSCLSTSDLPGIKRSVLPLRLLTSDFLVVNSSRSKSYRRGTILVHENQGMSTPGFDLSKLPAVPPPAGVVPNFTNPYTRGPLFVGLCAVALGFMYLFVAARFYSKLSIHRRVTWDDGK